MTMQRTIVRPAIGLAVALFIGMAMVPPRAVGQVAPAFSLPLLDDDTSIELDAFRGRVVYVDFWASWCLPCRKSFPWMSEMQQRYGARDFKVIAVNLDERAEEARRFLADRDAGFAVAYDPAGLVAEAYHVQGMPSAYLIDRLGKIRYVHQGFLHSDRAELERHIEQLLAEGDR